MTPAPFTIPGSAAIWLAIGWSVAGLGLMLLLWALFKDRARGRLRCPKCWYDMSGARAAKDGGTVELRCPECGRDARTTKRLGKTRRKWRIAFLAILVMLAGTAAISVPRVNKASIDGWWTIAPDWLLIEVVHQHGWKDATFGGVSGSGPPTPEDELWMRGRRGELSMSSVRQIVEHSGHVTVRTPRRWALDRPLPIGVVWPYWARALDPRRFDYWVVGLWPGAKPVQIPDWTSQQLLGPRSVRSMASGWIDDIPADPKLRIVRIEVCARGHQGTPLWTKDVLIDCDIAPSSDKALRPVPAEAFGDLLQRALCLSESLKGGNLCEGLSAEYISFENAGSSELSQLIETTVFAFRIEYLWRGSVVARGRGWFSWDPIEGRSSSGQPPMEILESNWDRVIGSELSIRLQTDEQAVLCDWSAVTYWSGDITLEARPPSGSSPIGRTPILLNAPTLPNGAWIE